MKQILHIFRKDTRHFWPEILLSLVAAVAFVFTEPHRWQYQFDQSPLIAVAGYVPFFIAIAWLLLITRVIHAEGLVADKEFWITRPYQWPKLLAAKLLFLAVWVCLPFFLAQFLLLAEARFHPLSYIPGLLLSLFLASAFAFLPLLSLAAVTSTFARMTLTLLGGFLLLIAFTSLFNLSQAYSTSALYAGPIPYVIVFCGCALAIPLQYAMRRVWLSRAVLIAAAILVLIANAAYRSQFMVDRTFPRPASTAVAPVNVTLAQAPIKARSYKGW
jgi:hypothetical protein